MATNSPPDCLLNASRPQRSFGMRENKRLFSHCRDRRPRLSVIFFFQAKKKEAKKSLGHLRLCPKPRNAFFGKWEDKRLFSNCMERCLFYVSYLLFQVLKKKQKSRRDTCGCVPDPATLFGVCNDLPRRARNAFFRKFFAYFFTKNKVSNLQCKSRKTNSDITITQAQKFFAYFFYKKKEIALYTKQKQKNQPW